MSAYTKTKTISKILIALGSIVIVVSGGFFAFSKSKIGADTINNVGGFPVTQTDVSNTGSGTAKTTGGSSPDLDATSNRTQSSIINGGTATGKTAQQLGVPNDYYIETLSDGSTPSTIYATNISSSDVLALFSGNKDNSSSKNGVDITRVTSSSCFFDTSKYTDQYCYKVNNSHSWTSPQITDPVNPTWSFLQETYNKAQANSDSAGAALIKTVQNNYVAAAYNAWKDARIVISENDTVSVVIYSDKFFSQLGEQAKTADPDCPITSSNQSGYKQMATMLIKTAYPDAKENSTWLKAADFTLSSYLKEWQSRGVELTDEINGINKAVQIYEGYARANKQTSSQGKVLSATWPQQFLITDTNSNNPAFSIKVDTNAFAPPSGGYKINFYLKPSARKDQDIYIRQAYTVPTSGSFGLKWSDFSFMGYRQYQNGTEVDAAISAEDTSYYDTKFPQNYYFKMVLYDTDGVKEKETLEGNFDTINNNWIGGAKAVSDKNSFLSLTAEPSTSNPSTPVKITLVVNDQSVAKAAVFVCKATAAQIKASNETPGVCTEKTSFTPKVENFQSDGKATFEYSWDTSGTTIGSYAVMAKAWDKDNKYLDPSKSVVDVMVTDTKIAATAAEHITDSHFADLLSGLFGSKASENARGSSLDTIPKIAQRIIDIIFGIIGILALFAILIAGIMYMSAGGDDTKAGKAKKALVYAVLGLALAIMSYSLIYVVIDMINHIIGGTTATGISDFTLKSIIGGDQTGFDLTTITKAIDTIFALALDLAGVVGFIMMMYASILYVLSVGEESKIETAKKTLTWSIVGIVFIAVARLIVLYIDQLLH